MIYRDRNNYWSCCGSDAQGAPNCDRPTAENFNAPPPQRMRPYYQAGVSPAQQSLPPGPPSGPRPTGAPPFPPDGLFPPLPQPNATTSESSSSRTRTWSREPVVVTVAPSASDKEASGGGGSSVSAGLAGGIGAACAVIAGLLALLLFIFCRRRKKKKQQKEMIQRPPSSTLGSYGRGGDLHSYASRTSIKPINQNPVEIHPGTRLPSVQVPLTPPELEPAMAPRELPAYRSQSYEPDALGISHADRPNTSTTNQTLSDIKNPISPPPPGAHPALAAYTKFPIHGQNSSSVDTSPEVSTYDSYNSTPSIVQATRQMPKWHEVTLPLSPSQNDILHQNMRQQVASQFPNPQQPVGTGPPIPARNPLRNSISTTTSREQLRTAHGTPNSNHSSGRSRANSFGGFQPQRRPSLEQSWSLETHPAPPTPIIEVNSPVELPSPIGPGKHPFKSAMAARMNVGGSISSVYSRDEAGNTLGSSHPTGPFGTPGTNYVVSPLSPQHHRQ